MLLSSAGLTRESDAALDSRSELPIHRYQSHFATDHENNRGSFQPAPQSMATQRTALESKSICDSRTEHTPFAAKQYDESPFAASKSTPFVPLQASENNTDRISQQQTFRTKDLRATKHACMRSIRCDRTRPILNSRRPVGQKQNNLRENEHGHIPRST